MRIESGNSSCVTGILDNNGNDLSRGGVSTYRQDVLGRCSDLQVSGGEIRVSFIHGGYDALCLGNVFVHAKGEKPYQDAVKYR